MALSGSPGEQDQPTLSGLEKRAKAILKVRSGYKEMVDFYLPVFRRQIEWRDRLAVKPDAVTDEQVRECLRSGAPLIDRFDPGMDSESLASLFAEMKSVFREGNEVLRQAMELLDKAEESGEFNPATWLAEFRPDRSDLSTDIAGRVGIEEAVLTNLASAVTFPHWRKVAGAWLPDGLLEEWRRFRCPTCGGGPALAETRTSGVGGENISPPTRRFMHCGFCGSCWAVPSLKCPSCESMKSGDAKYLFTPDEPEWRIDFCDGCHHYMKVINGDKVSGPVHVGLELLTAAHLDVLAQEKDLAPLELCA